MNETSAKGREPGPLSLGPFDALVKALTPNDPTDEPDPAPFKVHLLTRAGRLMRARSEPVRAFATKDEAVRFAGRQLGDHYAVYHKDKKIWPPP